MLSTIFAFFFAKSAFNIFNFHFQLVYFIRYISILLKRNCCDNIFFFNNVEFYLIYMGIYRVAFREYYNINCRPY